MDSDTASTLPQGVTHQKQQDYDIITWSNQDIAIDKWHVLLSLIAPFFSGAVALFFTVLLFYSLNDSSFSFGSRIFIFFIFGFSWLFVAGSVFWLPMATRDETIKISDEHISLTYSGRGAPKKEKRFSKHIFLKLVFEKYGGADDTESYPVLYILYASQFLGFDVKKKERLAIWMNKKDKYQIFLLLQQILKERNW